MKFDRQTIDLGWKTPLRVTKTGPKLKISDSPRGRTMDPITSDEPMLQAIQKVKDVRTFRRFCEKYGLLVFGNWMSDIALTKSERKLEDEIGHVFWYPHVREDYLPVLWNLLRPQIEALQEDIRNLEKYEDSNPKKYGDIIDKGVQAIRVRSGSPKDLSGITLILHASNLQAAVSLQVALADLVICEKPGCGVVFAKTRSDNRYCSPAHRPTKDSDLRKAKARVRRKLYYMWDTDQARYMKIHEEVKRELAEAEDEDQAMAVETKFKLAKRPAKKREA